MNCNNPKNRNVDPFKDGRNVSVKLQPWSLGCLAKCLSHGIDGDNCTEETK